MCMLVFVVEVRNFEMVAETSKVLVRIQRQMVNCLSQLFTVSKIM